MDHSSDDVRAHYGLGGLRRRIEQALEGRESVTEADVSGAAEFHIGGRPASKHLIAQLALDPGARVLDIGCGLGGTARLTAELTGASVTGLDLTPEFVDTASWLSELTGHADRTDFHVGSATDPLPWQARFDAATMIHVDVRGT